MHSTSSSEICPSAVTSLWPMPSFLQACSQSLSPSLQQATDVGADLHVVLAQRLAVQHGVVRQHLVDLQRRHAHAPRHFVDQLVGDRADFILRVQQHRNHRRALPARRIALAGACRIWLPVVEKKSYSAAMTRIPAFIRPLHLALSVRVPQHKIHAADGGDHIGDQRALHHLRRTPADCRSWASACARGKGFAVPSLTT